MTTTPAESTPCSDSLFPISVAMSGGGYRAAAYHLGTLSYLEHLNVLPHVEAISTVSGGTFTGTRYLLSLVEKQSFVEYLRDFYGFLLDTDLLDLAVRKLGPERTTNQLPRQLAIDAFAQVYADTLLRKKDGCVFTMKDIFELESPLTDVIFNSTEFRHGIGFRFQKSELPSKFGNGFESLPKDVAEKLRVADVLAASSCFPGGFEPIAWPESFHTTLPAVPIGRQLPMMDGGIYDNQGIESLLLVGRRSKTNPEISPASICDMDTSPQRFRMMIVSDTDRLDEQIYAFPPPPPPGLLGRLSVGTLGWIFWAVILLCLFTFIGNVSELCHVLSTPALQTPLRLTSHITSLFLSLAVVVLGLSVWNLFYRKLAPRIPHWDRMRNDLKHLLLSQVIEMVQLRISSLFALASNVFMKRIRGLLYAEVYDNDELKSTIVPSMIYKLRKYAPQWSTAEKERFTDTHAPDWPFANHPEIAKPSAMLLAIVDQSVKMPTTLWFDDNTMPAKLVATGHATLCFQLLSHLNFRYGPDLNESPPEVRQLWDHLLGDWARFQTDPYFVLRSQLPPDLHRTLPVLK